MSTFVYFPHNFFILKYLSKPVKKLKFSEKFCRFSFFMEKDFLFISLRKKFVHIFADYCFTVIKRQNEKSLQLTSSSESLKICFWLIFFPL